MKPNLLIAALSPLALAACIGPFARTAPYAYDKKGDLVEFNYAWPAEVTASGPLTRRLRADLERAFKAAEATAMGDRATATEMNRSFYGHKYSRRWTTAGQSPRLLSLDGRLMTFTGGAHPNQSAEGLLWDRNARAEIKPERLFATADKLDALVRVPGCAMLTSERARRLSAVASPGDVFSACPTTGFAVIPSDGNHNRRFDHIRLVAANGVAGAYVEGTYDISVPITATLLAAIKPAYRAGFEVAQPQ